MSVGPSMLVCPCGAPVNVVRDRASGETLLVERHASARGEGRYRILDYEQRPWVAEPVLAGADVMAYTAHELSCPHVRW
jgi:hypothetical protein